MFKLTFNQLMLLSSFVKEKKNYQANDKMVCLCKNPVLVDRFGVCAVCVDGSHHDVTETVWRVGRAVEWCLHGHICEWLTPRWRTSFSRIDSTVGRRRCFVRVNCDTRKQENQSKMHSYLCMAVLLFTVCALSEFSIQSKSPNISIRFDWLLFIWFIFIADAEEEVEFVCPNYKNTQFEHPKQCDRYYHCIEGKATSQLCPDGLVFDKSIRLLNKCTPIFNIDCEERTELRKYWRYTNGFLFLLRWMRCEERRLKWKKNTIKWIN